jgi:hypothetical protein
MEGYQEPAQNRMQVTPPAVVLEEPDSHSGQPWSLQPIVPSLVNFDPRLADVDSDQGPGKPTLRWLWMHVSFSSRA